VCVCVCERERERERKRESLIDHAGVLMELVQLVCVGVGVRLCGCVCVCDRERERERALDGWSGCAH